MTNTAPILSGYQMVEKLYDGMNTLIYKAKRDADQQPVVIKFLKSEYPSFDEIVQFRNQYTIAKNLDLSGIVQLYSLENYGNGLALIMEDMNGISLSEYTHSQPLTIDEFFNLVLPIVQTFEGIYSARVIHKDIKPQNILINPETQQIKLIDFSIASLLPRETQEIQSPNVLEGTLAYLSPEQTGRMNRGIDYRTDFYSLGVTFYELLTGQLPFQSEDQMELVHCHIAKIPTPPINVNPAIPSVVNDIIIKLMAKMAEDRYQSAYGLRQDLEGCQQQWQQNGNITPFPLGQRDISDRFHIPEKLYGRKAEITTLLAAFDRVSQGTAETMLVAGFSGIGKTVLVNEVHKPIVRQRGYFIKGKFDQFKRDIPFSAFVQAFQTLMRQLLTETATQVQAWKTKITEVLGDNGQVIIEVIPELEQIIGPQPPVPELEGSTAQNRFNLLFQNFINVFTTVEHPLVIFLDDLQWSDSASLKLMQLLMSQTDTHYLLLMGAYRDNEVSPAHPLMLTLDEIRKTAAKVNQLTLGPLEQSSLNSLIADTLSCPSERAKPLTELAIQKTQGNPFFTNQFLKFLHEEKLIAFDFNNGYWQCDIAQVKVRAVTDDVVEFMAIQLQKLPQGTQTVLKLAACIGNQFDLATLAIVHEKSQAETAADLWKALQEGLIIPLNDIYKFFQESEPGKTTEKDQPVPYKFLHDRVQQAAYSLISEDQKPSTHFKIGQLLKKNTHTEKLDDNIFDIVNQLNLGIDLITAQSERDDLAQLNLKAGHKARASTAYAAASKYLTIGLELLPSDSWQTQYNLTLALHESASEAAYLSGYFSRQEQLAEVVLAKAQSLLDKVKIYEVQNQAYIAQNRQLEAVKIVLPVLEQLGVKFSDEPTQEDILLELQETQRFLEGKQIETLCDLPIMTEENSLAAMRIMSSALAAAYQAVPVLFPLMIFKQVQLSVKYGNAQESTHGYSSYGLILCGIIGDIENGYKFGQLALNLLSRFNAKKFEAKVLDGVEGLIKHWKEPVGKTLKPLLEGYQGGLETGDFEFAAYCLHLYLAYSYLIGKELVGVEQEMVKYNSAIAQLKQETTLNYNEIYQQAILNLIGGAGTLAGSPQCYLIGEVYNEEKRLPLHQQANDKLAMYCLYFNKLILSFLFQDYVQAFENATTAEQHLEGATGTFAFPVFYFYDSLTRLAVYPDASEKEQQSHLVKVRANQEKLQKWAHHAPMNHQHKFLMVEAELHRVLGKNIEAMDCYDRAIAGAKENEYIQEEALANELAAKFYLGWGKEKIAQAYMIDAYYGYARWGAKAKVDDLEKRYPQSLSSILTQENSSQKATDMLAFFQTQTISATTSMGNTDFLDFKTVMKASQAISGEVHLDKLLVTMMHAVVENAGAEKGFLLLPKAEKWVIEAQYERELLPTNKKVSETTVLQSIPIEESSDIPVSIINYVSRTLELQVLDDASDETTFSADPYIAKQHPKSVLCAPLLNQKKLTGILYLENNLIASAFTPDRLEVINLLSSQIAISIENSLLYDNLETKVKERTYQLETQKNELAKTLEQLQAAQQQLVESEKMAALGNLVAGVAHEINTPVGVGVTAATQLDKITVDFATLYKSGKMTRATLEKFLNSAHQSSGLVLKNLNRAAELTQSFKQIAVDQSSEQRRTFELKKYLTEVLNSLRPNIQNTQYQVSMTCDETIQLTSYPGALSQILTNLIMNSINHGFQEQKFHGQIMVEGMVKEGEKEVILRYSDNGKGIPTDVIDKIFEPFFTTNRLRGGTGLGLHIVFNLITHRLKGTIQCESVEGQGTTFIISIPMSI
ncbi:ATP-binding sensor histidine kinase [Candidatus Parabeggiatoa sp. HSG14]|uniref:trifunctional serine/threonine-protein kinase/ATP-binding protein/sensor histidine kinase n=1 Tax=Candidatus Parabeggiatoa sp. HSG14 TaxID=3055593 RepID=UPI0025A92840|nr:ATP-binding sensor histidine kinase [Thiotrichales bacterium HSG14]